MWVFLLVFVVLLASTPKLFPDWWLKNRLVLIIALQFAWMLVAVIFSQELLLSVKFTLAKCWFLISFFIMPLFIFKEKKDFKKAFLLLLVPMLITVVIIMIRHAGMGFNFRRVERAIMPIYYNHVEYSTVLSMFFPLIVVAYLLNKGKTGLRIILFGIILFFLVAIYLSYARAAMVAVVFALLVGVAIRMRLVNWIMPGIYVVMIAIDGLYGQQ